MYPFRVLVGLVMKQLLVNTKRGSTKPTNSSSAVAREDVRLLRLVGQGSFGSVYFSLWSGAAVARRSGTGAVGFFLTPAEMAGEWDVWPGSTERGTFQKMSWGWTWSLPLHVPG